MEKHQKKSHGQRDRGVRQDAHPLKKKTRGSHKQDVRSLWEMLYLSACALHQVKPDSVQVGQMDLNKVYYASKRHGMASIACMVLEDAGALGGMDPSLSKSWKEEKEKAIRKNMLLDAERVQILGEMEKMGIWYVPLKGILLQSFYPKYGMRQMSDNDILYGVDGQKKLIAMMKKRGYKVESNPGAAHDVFTKPPIYNYEMHKSLFSKADGMEGYRYYQKIEKKLVKDGQTSYGYHFTDEDFYIYQTAHTHKHYVHSGTGLRSLMDAYVYIQKKGEGLDWDYIEGELAKLGIVEFEKQSRELALKIFGETHLPGDVQLTEKAREMFAFFAGSGTYGNIQNWVEHSLQGLPSQGNAFGRASKRQYLRRRLFPDLEWFQECYPFFARHKALIPFFVLYRIARGVFFRRKQIQSEIQALRNAGKKKENSLQHKDNQSIMGKNKET